MKQLIITIDDDQELYIETAIGQFTTFEFFGIAETLRLSAEEEERERIRLLLAAKEKQQNEVAKPARRSNTGTDH